ncbi:MAG: trypsin-like serine protease [Solirubrobacteraceae bacterium]|nr:trypsin-like serine protease [Solirubrobacteraceae bacterium]
MSSDKKTWPIAIISGLVGAGVAIAVAAVIGLGGGNGGTTVVQAGGGAIRPAASGEGLSASEIYRRDGRGVVSVLAEGVQSDSSSQFGLPDSGSGKSSGTGFAIDSEGTILTNAHVVDGAKKVTVGVGLDRDSAKTVDAKVLGADRSTDIAVLKVDPSGLNLRALPLGSSADVVVGDPVVAIGNPFGQVGTLTTGVVSAKGRQIDGLNGFAIDNVIQTDAAINPGNSGGPLIDAAGEVIGINSQIQTGGSNGSVGIGFAIPIDTARKLVPGLREGKVDTGYLGITNIGITPELKPLNLPVSKGVLIVSVQPGSPAAKAGLKGGTVPAELDGEKIMIGGDIIEKIDGRQMLTAAGVSAYVASKKAGDRIEIEYLRGGKDRKTVQVELGRRPQQNLKQ